ncbi:hypothetical protein AVEN_242981-1 [Araneus ventricosus]|uniref:Phlebovirus glycoprotein G2 fusion domain-containing protein n=1 Tax=Araneus ventricosus TaxID=182803 RepID=A0A4Y2D318_ARAVE|nr:hypothetical protein AVEN_242981-1 [Araneus ventricosus]
MPRRQEQNELYYRNIGRIRGDNSLFHPTYLCKVETCQNSETFIQYNCQCDSKHCLAEISNQGHLEAQKMAADYPPMSLYNVVILATTGKLQRHLSIVAKDCPNDPQVTTFSTTKKITDVPCANHASTMVNHLDHPDSTFFHH